MTLSDRPAVLSALLDYHLMIKVKAEMDRFKDWAFLQSDPSLWDEYFLALQVYKF